MMRLPHFCSASGMFADAEMDRFTTHKNSVPDARHAGQPQQLPVTHGGDFDCFFMEYWKKVVPIIFFK